MSDFISRQKAIEEIERNAYRHTYVEQIIGIIENLPSAEPEIIRCKDCDNWERIKSLAKIGSCDEFSNAENGMTRYTNENDFCSYAERRTDD